METLGGVSLREFQISLGLSFLIWKTTLQGDLGDLGKPSQGSAPRGLSGRGS